MSHNIRTGFISIGQSNSDYISGQSGTIWYHGMLYVLAVLRAS